MTDRFFIRLAGLFIVINSVLFWSKAWLQQQLGADTTVLLAGNAALALITLLSYWMSRKGLASSNNNAFVRMVYGSTLSKLMLCLAGIAIYVIINRSNTSKSAIFILMFLYVAYTVLETMSLYKLTRKKT